jgi:Domain of unknown function (DUF5666)
MDLHGGEYGGLCRTFARGYRGLRRPPGKLVVMKKLTVITAFAALAALPVAAPAVDAQTPTREFEGTVLSVNNDNRTFRLRDSERGTITVKVTRRTRYERINGFSGLRAGLRNVEATVRRSDGRWVASHVEISGGGGEHGGSNDDDSGSDDSSGRRGRGSDDGPNHS